MSHRQDTKAKEEASRAIADNGEKIEKHKRELGQREAELAREEKILEEIRDSLKGSQFVFVLVAPLTMNVRRPHASLPRQD